MKQINNKGFTLVELMISIAISIIVILGIYMVYNYQQKSFIAQEQVAMMQQNLRAGMYIAQNDIRMAGYNPANFSAPAPSITEALSSSIEFTRDDNTGTTTIDTYRYFHDNANNTLERTLNGTTQVVADGIVAVGFAYAFDTLGDGNNQLDRSPNGNVIWAIDSDDDGDLDRSLDTNDDGTVDGADSSAGLAFASLVPAIAEVPLTEIRAVKIWLLARSDREDKTIYDDTTYAVSDQRITPNNSFRHRILTTTIGCRNLEILDNN